MLTTHVRLLFVQSHLCCRYVEFEDEKEKLLRTRNLSGHLLIYNCLQN